MPKSMVFPAATNFPCAQSYTFTFAFAVRRFAPAGSGVNRMRHPWNPGGSDMNDTVPSRSDDDGAAVSERNDVFGVATWRTLMIRQE